MIFRIWHGWAIGDRAEAYQRLVTGTVVPGILDRGIRGLEGIDILRRRDQPGSETGFATIMRFRDWSAVEEFAGPAGGTSYVPADARLLLSRFDEHAQHYELISSQSPRS